MRVTGIIKSIIKKQDKASFGFITPDKTIPNYEGDIRFFADQLVDISLEEISKGDLVEFSLKEWKKKDGTVEKVAADINLMQQFLPENTSSTHYTNETEIFSNRFTGVINWVNQDEGRGFIKPDVSLGLDRDLIFFKDSLENVSITNISKGDKVDFVIRDWKRRDGDVVKVAKEIRLISDSPINTKNEESYRIEIVSVQNIKEKLILDMENTAAAVLEPSEFEDYVFLLLRLLGIHNLYQYDKKNQAGRADGFFIIGSLAVMYDCTLRKSFEEHKREQIENYVNKLRQSQLTIEIRRTDGGAGKKTLQISGKTRQVWIISPEKSREIQDFDGIRVKEIAVKDLIRIFKEKLYSDAFEEEELSGKLAIIDKTIG